MFSLASIIMGGGLVGFLCLSSMKGDEWIWGKNPSLDSILLNILDAFPCLLRCIKPPKMRSLAKMDRAREAKLRRQKVKTEKWKVLQEKEEREGAIGFGQGKYRDLMHKQLKEKDDVRGNQIEELLTNQANNNVGNNARPVTKIESALGGEENYDVEVDPEMGLAG